MASPLFPALFDSYQTANLTLPIALLGAVSWSYRDNRWVAGATIGVGIALKFFSGRCRLAGRDREPLAAASPSRCPRVSASDGALDGVGDYVRLLPNLSGRSTTSPARRSPCCSTWRPSDAAPAPWSSAGRSSSLPGGAGASGSRSGRRSCSRRWSGATSSPSCWCRSRSASRAPPGLGVPLGLWLVTALQRRDVADRPLGLASSARRYSPASAAAARLRVPAARTPSEPQASRATGGSSQAARYSNRGAGRNCFASRDGVLPALLDELGAGLPEESAGLHQVTDLLRVHAHEARPR